MSDFKPGDRLRVEAEHTVLRVDGDRIYVADPPFPNAYFSTGWDHIVYVEKLEPPVEVFRAGDVVVSEGGSRYHILSDGYVDGIFYYPWDDFVGRDAFTSERYTKVELVEKPF